MFNALNYAILKTQLQQIASVGGQDLVDAAVAARDQAVAAAATLVGTVANGLTAKGASAYASLPTTGNTIGDYYFCSDASTPGNYVWNGTAWYFGGTGDEGYSELKQTLVNLDTTPIIKDVELSANEYLDDGYFNLSEAFVTFEGLSIGVVSPIGDNLAYTVSVYVEGPPSERNNVFFWDASNHIIRPEFHSEYSYAMNGNGTITVIAPAGSVKLTYAIYATDKAQAVCVKHDEITNLNWLEVREDNLTDEVKAKLNGENIKTFVNKPFIFDGESAVFFGDSITQGFIDSGTTVTPNGYPKLFSDKVGMTFANLGAGGACFTPGMNEVNTIGTTLQGTTLTPYTMLFIAGGINDWQLGASLAAFESAVSSLFAHVKTNYTGEVFVIAPISCNFSNNEIAELDKYRNILGKHSILNGFSFINGKDFNFPNASGDLATALFGDGQLHPSEYGYQHYAKCLANAVC